jgi:hypothetical protein
VSPLQKVLTYYRGGAVLTGMPQWVWRLCEEWLVPLAEGLGYKVRGRAWRQVRCAAQRPLVRAGRLPALSKDHHKPPAGPPRTPHPHQALYPEYSTRPADGTPPAELLASLRDELADL